jgi:hypothetical protein
MATNGVRAVYVIKVNMIAGYQNGNVAVELFEDGTCTRTWQGDAKPEFPCSVDLKVTDKCTLEGGNCKWCHERSTKNGRHAVVERILNMVEGLPSGVELALGGGNVLEHPQIDILLIALADQKLVTNVTVNALHLRDPNAGRTLNCWRNDGLIYGTGISYNSECVAEIIAASDANTVVHYIAGVNSVWGAICKPFKKVLVLGYKQFGSGKKFYSEAVEKNIVEWRKWIGLLSKGRTVSFDNLAIEQLRLKESVPADYWNREYLGADGTFSMYVDAVKNEFAVSSVSPRKPMGGMTINEAFQVVQNEIKNKNKV